MSDTLAFSIDGLTLEASRELPNGNVLSLTNSWENLEDVPPYDELKKFAEKALDRLEADMNVGKKTTLRRLAPWLNGKDLAVGYSTGGEYDEASIVVGKFKLIWPVGDISKIKLVESDIKSIVGFGGKSAYWMLTTIAGKSK